MILKKEKITAVHQGLGGYIKLKDREYSIEHIESGVFSIHFPDGNKGGFLLKDFELITKFAEKQNPAWFVEDKRRKK